MKLSAPLLLCILDGLALNPVERGNAVRLASTPTLTRLFAEAPHTTLITHGERVGLPAGQMGNSEVGHMNIGAGRVVEQWLLRISRALQKDFLLESKEYQSWTNNISSAPRLHVIGLYSDGGVHSCRQHLHLLLPKLSRDFKGEILLHLISDGRDTSPHSALENIKELQNFLVEHKNCRIASLCGRFFAMDRDRRWERTKKAYDLIALGRGNRCDSIVKCIQASYAEGISDEFIEPIAFEAGPIGPKDVVLFWNFREDRMRQLVAALCLADFKGFAREGAHFQAQDVLCFTEYDHSFKLPYLFKPIILNNHLGEVLSRRGLRQLRVAETEKYAHVTYFFNAGVEAPFAGEERVLIPSPRDVRTYDQKPEMSAAEVTQVVLNSLSSRAHDVVVVNLANCDMVGHTGVLSAAIKAVETVDSCLGQMLKVLESQNGMGVITADHGNADQMINYEDGSPHTAHTTHPVPFWIVGCPDRITLQDGGALCNVAPTLLDLLHAEKPAEMPASSLIRRI